MKLWNLQFNNKPPIFSMLQVRSFRQDQTHRWWAFEYSFAVSCGLGVLRLLTFGLFSVFPSFESFNEISRCWPARFNGPRQFFFLRLPFLAIKAPKEFSDIVLHTWLVSHMALFLNYWTARIFFFNRLLSFLLKDWGSFAIFLKNLFESL